MNAYVFMNIGLASRDERHTPAPFLTQLTKCVKTLAAKRKTQILAA